MRVPAEYSDTLLHIAEFTTEPGDFGSQQGVPPPTYLQGRRESSATVVTFYQGTPDDYKVTPT